MCRRETKYLVAVDTTKLEMSNKYTYIQKKFKPEEKPHIVTLDWLLDCMEQGQILEPQAKHLANSINWLKQI